MATRPSLLDLEPEVQQGMKMAADVIGKLLEGPDFPGKKILQLLSQGMTLSEILGISRKQLDAVFQKATQLLEAGEMNNSRALFTLLVRLQPYDERYTYGLATTYQIEGQYRTAGRLYATYLAMNAECVHGRLRLGECLLAEKEYEPAIEMFTSVVRDEEATEDLPELRAYAEDMRERCARLKAGPVVH